MPDHALLDRMDAFDASRFEAVKLSDEFFGLLIDLSRWLNARLPLATDFAAKAEQVLIDLTAAIEARDFRAAPFAGDYADDVYAVYGEYDFDYEKRTPSENAVLVWGYVFEICRNLIGLRGMEDGVANAAFLDGEFSLSWMVPLMDAAARTGLVTQDLIERYFYDFAETGGPSAAKQSMALLEGAVA